MSREYSEALHAESPPRWAILRASLLAAATGAACFGSALAAGETGAQREYLTQRDLTSELSRLAGDSDGLVKVSELCPSCEGEPVPLVTIGGDDPSRPAVLVVAGLDGRHLLGTELAVDLMRAIVLEPDSSRARFADRSLYIVPRLDAEGARVALEEVPARLRAGVPGPSDRDRDGLSDEDRADDLNGDRIISLVRVEDPDGDWLIRPNHPDLLRRARSETGEAGRWRLLLEGRDDDRDERWNEEEDGGVIPGATFPMQYEWFTAGRGRIPLGEPNARALADFVVSHPGIGAVLVYGFEDNLLTAPPESKTSDPDPRGRGDRQPIVEPNKADLPYILEIGKRYRKSLGLAENDRAGFTGFGVALEAEEMSPIPNAEQAAKGGFASFVYYARGRLAVATPGWSPAFQKKILDARKKKERTKDVGTAPDSSGRGGALADSVSQDDASETDRMRNASSDPAVPSTSDSIGVKRVPAAPSDTTSKPLDSDDSRDSDDSEPGLDEEAVFLTWLRSVDPTAWLGWQEIKHPDFPGRPAFVGGYHPLARVNPPAAILDSLSAPHTQLALELVDGLPRVRIRVAELVALGSGLHELRLTIENVGYLPDVLAQGEISDEIRATRFEISLPPGAAVIGESARGVVERLAGSGGATTVRRMIQLGGNDRVTIRVVAEAGGTDERTITPGAPWRSEQ